MSSALSKLLQRRHLEGRLVVAVMLAVRIDHRFDQRVHIWSDRWETFVAWTLCRSRGCAAAKHELLNRYRRTHSFQNLASYRLSHDLSSEYFPSTSTANDYISHPLARL